MQQIRNTGYFFSQQYGVQYSTVQYSTVQYSEMKGSRLRMRDCEAAPDHKVDTKGENLFLGTVCKKKLYPRSNQADLSHALRVTGTRKKWRKQASSDASDAADAAVVVVAAVTLMKGTGAQ
ncbi:uncharacterized protein UTRI_02355 [Ustilago trichophora]|uniref:Uncharacterized protein n=1 Tax=Ustilago trichophora TaxID=86804 RepID=A0A5C3E945_9BASI|nr:uncharacterized protein UTRI_02355 [Ustilago trichophora]